MKELLSLMFRIGIIGFGGGSALIPVIEKEAVESRKLISAETYSKHVVVASITPGALPVELSGGIGWLHGGVKGMFLSALAMALPGAIATVFCTALLSLVGENILIQVNILSVGISAFIMVILSEYLFRVHKQGRDTGRLIKTWFIILTVFFLTSEKKLASILGITWTPVFNISTLNIFVMVFFVAAFSRGCFTKAKWLVIFVLCGLYLLCIGKGNFISAWYVKDGVEALMALLGIHGIWQELSLHFRRAGAKKILCDEGFLLALLILSAVPAIIMFPTLATKFTFYSLLSSFMSFGGGDAFLAVADAVFVVNEIIHGDLFYGQIVPIVNVMPGSILCKTLTGIGYCAGFAEGSLLQGFALALVGLIAGVVGSCTVFYLMLMLYEKLESMSFLRVLKYWIQPIIAGMLLNVAVSLMNQNVKVGKLLDVNLGEVWFITVGISLLAAVLSVRMNINRFGVAAVSAVCASLFFNLM